MILRVPKACWTLLWVACFVLPGCGKSNPWNRVALHGNVTLPEVSNPDDVNGMLTILPAADNKGPAASTAIKAGKYKFDSTNGPVPGNCDVVARIYVPVPAEPGAKPGTPPVHVKPMPGSKVELTKSIYLPEKKKSIQVPAEKTFQLNLDM